MLLETPIVQLGQKAPRFSLPNLDGTLITSESAMGENGLVVAFICNHCPYVKAIAKDLSADARVLATAGISLVGIMSNDYQRHSADSPARMREFASQHDFDFPYLLDEDQSVAKAYGAVCTPDFFGYDGEGKLQYRGRLDNGNVRRPENRRAELVEAMKQIADSGITPSDQKNSIGCSIKWR
ncbi:MAG: peroxiredoxin [Polyangiales bacterium]|jgi:peroxiredoxin